MIKDIIIIILIIILIIVLGVRFFYRAPKIVRKDYKETEIYGPCYGIVEAVLHDAEKHQKMISIFLRISDIHSQYYPVSGELISRVKVKGKYKLATSLPSTEQNARTITTISTKHGPVIVEQISGKLARKISNGPQTIGEDVVAGEYLGRIHLGSRVNIYMPDNYNIIVEKNQYVNGPDTILALIA